MVALHAFPQLKARGFFTLVEGVEYYFAALQEMEIESTYKSFYEEYDVAFNLRCTYSICDYKKESRWLRMSGDQHVYRTPLLYVINRIDLDESPAQIANRMISYYRANMLVIEKYNHPEYSVSSLNSYLKANGIYFIIKSPETENATEGKTEKVNSNEAIEYPKSIAAPLSKMQDNKNSEELQCLFDN